MTNVPCEEPRCDNDAVARGLCSSHYGVRHRNGQFESSPDRRYTRQVSDIDVDGRTLTCGVHGAGAPLRVRQREVSVYYTCRKCEGKGRGDRKRQWRRSKYGLSDTEFAIMVMAQAGRCLICQEECPDLVVDHDHESGAVRGLLCHRCNVALGWMNDNPTNLERAARYLRRKVA